MLIAHAPLAGIANKLAQGKKMHNFSRGKRVIIFGTALIAGILPDFDFFYLIAKNEPVFNHHDLITHSPIFWILIYALGRLLLKFAYKKTTKKFRDSFSKEFMTVILNAFFIGVMSHLLADLLTGSIMLLYPLSSRGFSLLSSIMPVNMFGGYSSYPIFYIELAIVFLFTTLVFSHVMKLPKKKFFKAIAIPLGLVTALSTAIYFQNYNPTYIAQDKGVYKFDQDYDKITDSADWDTDNDGKSNIEDVTSSDTLKVAQEVSKERMFSVKYDEESRTLGEKIMFQFGSVDSYRLVQMTYILNNSPIPPVLIHELNLGETPAYWHDIEEDEELFKFYVERDLLDQIRLSNSLERYQGNVIFMLNGDEEIINMGIVLKDNNLLITFGNGEIVHHSEEVMGQLEDDLEKVMVVR